MAKKRRFRYPSPPKEGELSIKYGRVHGQDDPDLVFSAGAGCLKTDIGKIHNLLNRPLWEQFTIHNDEPPPSILDELDKLGYDITTLKFSIKLKETEE